MHRKILSLSIIVAFLLLVFAACSPTIPPAAESDSSAGSSQAPSAAEPAAPPAEDATKLEYWTFQELHIEFFEEMMNKWNAGNPSEQIVLEASAYPYDDMHNKLLVALQSGVGAPDIVDIELNKFPNYLKGDIQLTPLNDVVEPELGNIVRSRVDIYSKDGNFYGICFHVGAAVIYYNAELCEQAGVDWKSIKTWDDYYEAGKTFKAASPESAWTSLEVTDVWHMWPLLASQGGDILAKDGTPNINSPEMVKVLEYNQKLLNEGVAITPPGDYHHAEEFYGLMNSGGVASIVMPMWYLDRFTNYMPDLSHKMAVAPIPVWEAGQPRSVGQGGTGTAVTNQSEHQDLAKRFLAFAKLSKEGNITAWKTMGFDPIRTEVWNLPELRENNKFIEYYVTDPLDVLIEIKDEIPGVVVAEALPATIDAMKNSVLYRAYVEKADVQSMLAEEEAKITY